MLTAITSNLGVTVIFVLAFRAYGLGSILAEGSIILQTKFTDQQLVPWTHFLHRPLVAKMRVTLTSESLVVRYAWPSRNLLVGQVVVPAYTRLSCDSAY